MPTLPQPTILKSIRNHREKESPAERHLRTKPGQSIKPFTPAHLYSLPPGALLTPAEVGSLFRVDSKTVTRWPTLEGIGSKLRVFKTLGGHNRFCVEDVRNLYGQNSGPDAGR